MVNVIYGEHSRQAELAGKTVAEAREMFESEFDLSDRAQANLNGQWLKKRLESETGLCDDDELYFEERSRRGLVMVGAFLLTLAITGGLFAYTATTGAVTIGVTAASPDYASITANNSVVYNTGNITGKTVGKINAGVMFDVTKNPQYTGDLEVIVSLANADDLVTEYSSWQIRLKFTDGTVSNGVDTENSTQVISLVNPTVSFAVDSSNLTVTRYIHCIGGSYKTLSSSLWSGQGYDPMIFAQVVQAGAH